MQISGKFSATSCFFAFPHKKTARKRIPGCRMTGSRQLRPNLSLRMTSCEPPSTMLVAETSVIFAFSRSSGSVSAPQLLNVEQLYARIMMT